MSEFFDNYLNIKKMRESKREFKQLMARVDRMPEEYSFVFKKIQQHMWKFAAGSGYDMLEIQKELVELFESGAANGQHVLEITGDDVAAFCDELLRNARTYMEDWRKALNDDIRKKFRS
ncbi:MAG: DUF1048 domain-containing protein [Ruminococcaceae bacterium]|nr:DUF1048 domain-containing protein [Oscillospiraceae bacterium]